MTRPQRQTAKKVSYADADASLETDDEYTDNKSKRVRITTSKGKGQRKGEKEGKKKGKGRQLEEEDEEEEETSSEGTDEFASKSLMELLPEEIRYHILQFTDHRTLYSLSLASKSLKDIVDPRENRRIERLWKTARKGEIEDRSGANELQVAHAAYWNTDFRLTEPPKTKGGKYKWTKKEQDLDSAYRRQKILDDHPECRSQLVKKNGEWCFPKCPSSKCSREGDTYGKAGNGKVGISVRECTVCRSTARKRDEDKAKDPEFVPNYSRGDPTIKQGSGTFLWNQKVAKSREAWPDIDLDDPGFKCSDDDLEPSEDNVTGKKYTKRIGLDPAARPPHPRLNQTDPTLEIPLPEFVPNTHIPFPIDNHIAVSNYRRIVTDLSEGDVAADWIEPPKGAVCSFKLKDSEGCGVNLDWLLNAYVCVAKRGGGRFVVTYWWNTCYKCSKKNVDASFEDADPAEYASAGKKRRQKIRASLWSVAVSLRSRNAKYEKELEIPKKKRFDTLAGGEKRGTGLLLHFILTLPTHGGRRSSADILKLQPLNEKSKHFGELLDNFAENAVCSVTGRPVKTSGTHDRESDWFSIDRIDSSLRYIHPQQTLSLTSWGLNCMFGDMTEDRREDLLDFAKNAKLDVARAARKVQLQMMCSDDDEDAGIDDLDDAKRLLSDNGWSPARIKADWNGNDDHRIALQKLRRYSEGGAGRTVEDSTGKKFLDRQDWVAGGGAKEQNAFARKFVEAGGGIDQVTGYSAVRWTESEDGTMLGWGLDLQIDRLFDDSLYSVDTTWMIFGGFNKLKGQLPCFRSEEAFEEFLKGQPRLLALRESHDNFEVARTIIIAEATSGPKDGLY